MPIYTGYVVWRGLVEIPSGLEQKDFQEHSPYFVFPNGHLLVYRVPAKDYKTSGATYLNWVMYEDRSGESLTDLLIDKSGKSHARSVPSGLLPEKQI